MARRRVILEIVIGTSLVLALTAPAWHIAVAQEEVGITIFVDKDYLIVYVPGTQHVSLQDLGFEVTVNNQRQDFRLDQYTSFQTLRFDSVPVPICFRLARDGTSSVLPDECDPNRTLTHFVSSANVFWYDSVANRARTLLLIRGVEPLDFCAAGQVSCELVYPPPAFTPTPSSTFTPIPTDTPLPTPSPVPTDTPIFTATFTPTFMPTITPSLTPTFDPPQATLELARNFSGGNRDWKPIVQVFNDVEMVLVPAGCFMMGYDYYYSDEQPVHRVCFDAPFWIDRTEVTNAQYGSYGSFSGDQRPRESVTWTEAQDFCESRGARLPSEAEWEYAARGPDAWEFPWGNEFDGNKVIVNGLGSSNSEGTAPVGSRPEGASWVGALDMSGNVYEWVADWYDPGYYSTLQDGAINPTGPETGEIHVARGGSWNAGDEGPLLTTSRVRSYPVDGDGDLGFRCARSQ